MSKRIVVDTNIILNRPELLRSITRFCDVVYIPRTVIRELNYQKDHGDKQRKTLASLCLSMLIELKNDNFVIDDGSFVEGNNDDRIWGLATALAEKYCNDIIYLFTNDKDFKLKTTSGLSNLKILNSSDFNLRNCLPPFGEGIMIMLKNCWLLW